jgi:hypothetical protein
MLSVASGEGRCSLDCPQHSPQASRTIARPASPFTISGAGPKPRDGVGTPYPTTGRVLRVPATHYRKSALSKHQPATARFASLLRTPGLSHLESDAPSVGIFSPQDVRAKPMRSPLASSPTAAFTSVAGFVQGSYTSQGWGDGAAHSATRERLLPATAHALICTPPHYTRQWHWSRGSFSLAYFEHVFGIT